MKSSNIIIIHGCPSKKEDLIDITYDKHWILWVKRELTLKGLSVETPLMPEPWQPVYKKFEQEFEKCKITEETTLIGHSCGCAFLVRWLGNTKQKVKKLILVAPWKIPTKPDKYREAFYNYEIDKKISSRVKEIVMFTSDNEAENGKKSLKLYHDALGGKIIDLKGKGHYTLDEMGTQEFPELVEEIIKK